MGIVNPAAELKMLIAINYHYLRPEFNHPYPGIYGVTLTQFSRQLEMLGKIGEFVSASDIREAIRMDKPLPERSWLVSFDDGLREQYEYAWPILQRRSIPALFFINSDPVENSRISSVHKIHLLRANVLPERLMESFDRHMEQFGINWHEIDPSKAMGQYKYDTAEVARLKYLLNFALNPSDLDRLVDACFRELLCWSEEKVCKELYMSPEQVGILGVNGCVGSHAHQHLPLGMLSTEDIAYQIHLSRDLLSKWSKSEIYVLSYPYGSIDACSALAGEVARKEGYEFAFTMERAGNVQLDAPMFLARCACNDLPGGTSPQWTLDNVFTEIPTASWGVPVKN